MNRRTLWLSALVGAAAGIAAWILRTQSGVDNPWFDAYYYWRMAEGHRTWAPFGYRVLGPAFVRALPLGTDGGFVVLTGLSVAVLVGASYTWLSRRASPARAVAGVAIICSSTAVLVQLHVPYATDVTMLALVAICALAADRTSWLVFAFTAVAAVLTREAAVVVALVPVAAFARTRNPRALIASVAPLVALFAVRDLASVFARPLQRPSDVFHYVATTHGGLGPAAVVAVAASFGSAWLFVPFGWSRLDVVSKSWALVAVASLPVLLIATGWGRLVAPSFVLVAACAVKSPVRTWGLYTVAGLTALMSFSPDNLVLAVATVSCGTCAIFLARTTRGGTSAVEPPTTVLASSQRPG